METFRGQISMATWVIEVTEFDYEAKCDLRGCLEAAMASEATKMAVRGNMHNDARVIEVADFKSKVKYEFGDHCHCCPLVLKARNWPISNVSFRRR